MKHTVTRIEGKWHVHVPVSSNEIGLLVELLMFATESSERATLLFSLGLAHEAMFPGLPAHSPMGNCWGWDGIRWERRRR